MRNSNKIVDTSPEQDTGAVERIRARLEQLILSGKLSPGERLNELALAARLEVSRGHLREAVRALEAARLVQIVANRGAHVRKLDLPEALQLFDVRAGLARAAGRLAALKATRKQLKEVRNVQRHMGAAAARGEIARFQELNLRLHALLFDAAANARLRDIDLAVRNEMQLYIRENVSSESQLRVSCEEHGAIVTALLAGDADACSAAFENHILNGKRRLLDAIPRPR